MFSCRRVAAARASASKRRTSVVLLALSCGSTLRAQFRLRVGSRARYTAPMPPAPIFFTISYLPIVLIAGLALADGRSGGGADDCDGLGDPLGVAITHLASTSQGPERTAVQTCRAAE